MSLSPISHAESPTQSNPRALPEPIERVLRSIKEKTDLLWGEIASASSPGSIESLKEKISDLSRIVCKEQIDSIGKACRRAKRSAESGETSESEETPPEELAMKQLAILYRLAPDTAITSETLSQSAKAVLASRIETLLAEALSFHLPSLGDIFDVEHPPSEDPRIARLKVWKRKEFASAELWNNPHFVNDYTFAINNLFKIFLEIFSKESAYTKEQIIWELSSFMEEITEELCGLDYEPLVEMAVEFPYLLLQLLLSAWTKENSLCKKALAIEFFRGISQKLIDNAEEDREVFRLKQAEFDAFILRLKQTDLPEQSDLDKQEHIDFSHQQKKVSTLLFSKIEKPVPLTLQEMVAKLNELASLMGMPAQYQEKDLYPTGFLNYSVDHRISEKESLSRFIDLFNDHIRFLLQQFPLPL